MKLTLTIARVRPLLIATLCTALAMIGFAGEAFAQPKGQPPVIDRELFFGDPEIVGAQISPDGKFIAFIKPFKGTRNIWVKKISEPFSAARPVSAEVKRPVRGNFWSQDSKFILYAQDAGGDENFNVYAVDPALAADPVTGVPPTRALTNLQCVRTVIYAVPRTKPDIIYIGLNDRDARWHDLYELHLSTGEKTLLRKNTERITGWVFDHDATLRLAASIPLASAVVAGGVPRLPQYMDYLRTSRQRRRAGWWRAAARRAGLEPVPVARTPRAPLRLLVFVMPGGTRAGWPLTQGNQ